MKRLLLIALGSLLLAPLVPAIIDTNNNGISDLWEKANNTGQLFSENYDPDADPDHDGWTNAQEAAAGTKPGDPNPPDGFLQPEITHTPDIWGYAGGDNILKIITPEAVTVSWTSIPGKQYILLYSPDLAPENWIPVGAPYIGNGNEFVYGYPIQGTDKWFWRVAVTDVDTDGDTLSDAEEYALGTNPALADTDSDTVPDADEVALGSDPSDLDSDDDLVTNAEEAAAGTDMNNAEDFPPFWIVATNRVIGGTNKFNGKYGGSIRYLKWDMSSIPNKSLNDMLTDIDPATMVTERDNLALPSTAVEALSAGESHVTTQNLNGGIPPSGGANFFRSDDAGSSGNYSSTRCWLCVPLKDHPREFRFLKYVRHTRTGNGDNVDQIVSCEVLPITIAANKTTSDPVDLKNDTPVSTGKTNITTTSLVTADLKISNGQDAVKEVMDKFGVGAFTVANLNDSDGDGITDKDDNDVPGEKDLMKLRIIGFDGLAGKIKLTVKGGSVRFWEQKEKKIEIPQTAGAAFVDVTTGSLNKSIWIEATAVSSVVRDIEIWEGYQPPQGALLDELSKVKATAVWAEFLSKKTQNADVIWQGCSDNLKNFFSQEIFQFGPLYDTGMKSAQFTIGLEFKTFPAGLAAEAPVKFDMARQHEGNIWSINAGVAQEVPGESRSWPLLPDESNDDSHQEDEDSIPDNDRVYSIDSPGLSYGAPKQHVEIVMKFNFKEFVRVWFEAGNLEGNNANGSRCSGKEEWNTQAWLIKSNGRTPNYPAYAPKPNMPNNVFPGNIAITPPQP